MRTRRSGFSLFEILLVLVVTGVLGGIALVHAGVPREKAQEAVMRGDLRTFVHLEEMRYTQQKRYAKVADLGDLHLSDEVAVEASDLSADGERVYLQLRHTQTQKRCSVDFSRSSPNAINRIRCFTGPDVRAPADTAEGAKVATYTVPNPPAPEGPPMDPGGNLLEAPLVSYPADQSGLPAQAFSNTFTVTNRSTVGRDFGFLLSSSNPSVVATPPTPANATIPAGGSVAVTVPYTVGIGAEASSFSAITLKATDLQDPSLAGKGDFTVSAGLAMQSPWLSSPADLIVDPGNDFTLSWSVQNRTNAPRNLVVTPQGEQPPAVLNARPTLAGVVALLSAETKSASTTYHLDYEGAEGGQVYPIRIDLADQEDPSAYNASDVVNVTARLILANPVIQKPADKTVLPGATFTDTWVVTNTSNAGRVLNIVPAVTGDLTVVSSANTGSQTLAKRSSITVTVTYRLASTSINPTTSVAWLTITDVGAPAYTATDSYKVYTALVLKSPTLSSPPDVTAQPEATFSQSWTVKNETNAARVLVVSPGVSNAEISISSSSNTGSVSFQPFEVKTVTVNYQVASVSVSGSTTTATLQAYDAVSSSYASSDAFTFTTATLDKAPVVSAPSSAGYDPQACYTLSFSTKNGSNISRSFSFSATSSNTGVVPDPADPATATFAAYEARSVPVTICVNWVAAGSSSTVTLEATNTTTGQVSSASFTATVNAILRNPVVTAPGGASAQPGQSFSQVWSVQNVGNSTRTLLASADASGSISVSGAPGTGGVSFAPFETKTFTISYQTANPSVAGSAGMGTLSAADAGNGVYSGSGSFSFSTAVLDQVPSVTVNSGGLTLAPQQWHGGSFSIYNPSNISRGFSLSAATSNAGFASDPADPTSITIGPYSWSSAVAVSFYMQWVQAGSSAAIGLTATNQSSGQAGSASFGVITGSAARAPVISRPSDVTVYKGTSVSNPFTVTNQSNFTESFSGTYGSGNYAVVNNNSVAGCSAGMGGSCTMYHNWYAGQQGSTWVSVSAAGSGGTSSSQTYSASVPNRAPSISGVSPNYTSVEAGQTVCFSVSVSDPDGDALTSQINSGDSNIVISGTSGCHQYNSAGQFFPQGMTYDPYGGQTWSATSQVDVRPPTCKDPVARNYAGTLPCTYSNDPPIVTLSASATSIKKGEAVTFSVGASDPNGDGISSYSFTPGTGGTVSAQSGTVSFPSPGTYTATGSATDNYAGGSRTGTSSPATITVHDYCSDPGATNYGEIDKPCQFYTNTLPTVAFTCSTSQAGSSEVRAVCNDQSTDNGSIIAWAWSPGGGWTADETGRSASSYQFRANSNVSLTLSVVDNDNASASLTKTVSVSCLDSGASNYGGSLPCQYPPPTVSWSAVVTHTTCNTYQVEMSGWATAYGASITSWNWAWSVGSGKIMDDNMASGQGSSRYTFYVDNIWPTEGSVKVEVTVQDSGGRTGTYLGTVRIPPMGSC